MYIFQGQLVKFPNGTNNLIAKLDKMNNATFWYDSPYISDNPDILWSCVTNGYTNAMKCIRDYMYRYTDQLTKYAAQSWISADTLKSLFHYVKTQRLISSVTRLFVHRFVQIDNKEKMKAPIDFARGHRWIPITKVLWCTKRFHDMISSSNRHIFCVVARIFFSACSCSSPGLLWLTWIYLKTSMNK